MAKRTRFSIPPPAALALIYATFIALGSVCLMLPIAQERPVAPIDAIFISTSAVTVTGLITVDPGTSFTFFGEAVIAVLIQFGGLGLMTFAALLATSLGLKVGLPSRMVLREELSQVSMRNVALLAQVVFTFALVGEVVGAVILATVFVPDFGWAQGLWHAAFQSISAFNNAGFSTFPSSLMNYASNARVNLVISLLFITGGLGFVVVADIWQRRRWSLLSLHSKLMLAGTFWLILVSWAAFALLEWDNPGTIGDRALDAKLLASWFQAVTPRTAGFNTIETAAMKDSTTLMTIVLMVIGGGSTSTAGGIKVTTFIVFLLATVAFFRRDTTLTAFGRSVGVEEVLKVMAITTISLLFILAALFVLMIVNPADPMLMLFEVASAFGTVGLTVGGTEELDPAGKVVVMITMFVGRVGPLTLGFFLAARSRPLVRYPAGRIYLG